MNHITDLESLRQAQYTLNHIIDHEQHNAEDNAINDDPLSYNAQRCSLITPLLRIAGVRRQYMEQQKEQ